MDCGALVSLVSRRAAICSPISQASAPSSPAHSPLNGPHLPATSNVIARSGPTSQTVPISFSISSLEHKHAQHHVTHTGTCRARDCQAHSYNHLRPWSRRQWCRLVREMFPQGVLSTDSLYRMQLAENFRGRGKFEHVKFVFPNAPNIPITVNFGMSMPGWYDIVSKAFLVLASIRSSADMCSLFKARVGREALQSMIFSTPPSVSIARLYTRPSNSIRKLKFQYRLR